MTGYPAIARQRKEWHVHHGGAYMNGRGERPRPWFTLDNSYLTRGSIETLLDKFGAAGALAVMALIAETNAAIGGGKRSDFDVLDWHYTYLARRIRTDAATARKIVLAAVDVGLIELVAEDGDGFTVRLLRWKEWHPKDPLAADRKRQQRARDRL